VNLTEPVLHLFEVIAPSPVFDGKKILYDVAEALDANAQAVERHLGAVAQSAGVEFAGCGPALKSKMLEEGALRTDAGGARGRDLLHWIATACHRTVQARRGPLLLFVLAAVQYFEEGGRRSIVGVEPRESWRIR
jgi:predicted ArsR family transcriptional regulator